MFQLTKVEFESLRSQFAPFETGNFQRSQFATFENYHWKHSKYLPHAFTEHGIAMLSAILNSEKTIQMNIAIIRAFIEMRRYAIVHADWKAQIYDALENLLDVSAAQHKREDRERIGFK